jgi:hypothetical protein
MKTAHRKWWFFAIVLLAISSVRASDNDADFSQPLTQSTFDQLIPTSYPTLRTRFDRLLPTTWPLIDPGIPRIHITENLVHPLSQPLLIVNPAREPKKVAPPRRTPPSTGRKAPQSR